MQLKPFFCLNESNQNAKDFVSQPFHMGINRVFLYDLERDVVYSYLNPQKFCSGPWRRQVFKLSGPLVGEYCSSCFVFSIPLDRPATIQEILAGIVTS